MGLLPATQWVAASGLIWTSYADSDDWVVYNPASADIHLLTPFAQRLLHVADGVPRTVDDLLHLLALDLGIPADGELEEAVATAVTSLDRAGLLSRVLAPSW